MNSYDTTIPLCDDPDGDCVMAHRARFGLPTDTSTVVLANFNSHSKIDALVFRVWMAVMRQTSGTVLWLAAPREAAVKARLRSEALASGVAPDRLFFAPPWSHHEHLSRYQAVDVFLDTHWYTAHSTASDALWGAAPLLTCPSASFQGRVAASLLEWVRAPWLVVASLKVSFRRLHRWRCVALGSLQVCGACWVTPDFPGV